MTFDDEFDSYDPVVAERFTLLDRATMPRRDALPPTTPEAPVVGTRHGGSRPWYHLAAAAAVAVVAGASVVAIAQLGDRQDVQATTGDNLSIEADETPSDEDRQSEKRSLTVEVPSPDPAPTGDTRTGADSEAEPPADDQVTGDSSADEPDSAATTTTQPADQSNSDGTAPGIEGTTGSTEAPDPSTTSTTSTSRPSTTTEAPPTSAEGTVRTTTTRDLTPGSSWLDPPTPEKMLTITGVVTEVFTDCMSRLILNDAGKVESIGPVSCDGGSYIIVDGVRIQTTSGFTEADSQFGKHPAWLRPGHTVKVTAVPTGAGGRLLSLDCVQCLVQLG